MPLLIIRRVAAFPVIALIVATIVFIALRVIPGNAADVLAQQATALQKVQIARALGLDKSYWTQYVLFLKSIIHGNLGYSFYSGQSVSSRLASALPVTIELSVAASFIMIPFGLIMGMLAAAFRHTFVDSTARFTSTLLMSVPWFALGIILILLFGVEFHLLPTFGRLPPTMTYNPKTHFIVIDAILENRYGLIIPWFEHLILPAVTVGLINSAAIMRITRSVFLETLTADFVRTARMKGMSEWRVFTRHVFRHAALPILTVVGLQVGGLLAGAVITENVFAYPGVGRLMVGAIFQRDYPLIQGAALCIALMYVLVNTVTDLLGLYLDPRIART